AEQAKLKWLPYTSLLEFVAERYHSAESYIQKLNPGKNWEHLQPGETLKVPNVLPFEVEKFAEGKVPENPAFGSRKIFVDTYEHLLEVFDQDQLVCVFPLKRDPKHCRRPWAAGRFPVRMFCLGSGTVEACLTTACAPKTN